MAKKKNNKVRLARLHRVGAKFSFTQLFIFAVVFGSMGSFLLWQTYAARPINKNTSLSFQSGAATTNTGRHIAQPVDWLSWCGDCVSADYKSQNPWVSNPTTCMWDTDDWFKYISSGSSLAAGASTGIKECSYEFTSYNNPNAKKTSVIHAAYFNITAPSPNLQVTETFSWEGGSHTFTASPAWNATTKSYDYRQCMEVGGVKNGTWVSIPNSNGGYGVPVTITTTITNPTSRNISNIGGVIQYGWQQFYGAGCQVSFPGPLG